MINIEMAKLDPSSVFQHPSQVLREDCLSPKDKIDILLQWAYDEREMAVAEEENMCGPGADKNNRLDEVLKALLELGVDETGKAPPTKQG